MTFKNIYPLPSHELREILASPRNTKRLKEGYYLFMFVSPTRILFAHVQFNVSRSIWVLQPMCIDYTFGHEIFNKFNSNPTYNENANMTSTCKLTFI